MFKIIVAEENTPEVVMEAYKLAEAHYYEVEAKSSQIPFGLDLNLMMELLKLNLLYIVTARVDGELIGYFANIINPDIFTGKMVTKELGIYVKEKFRGSTAFPRMLGVAEKLAIEKGAYSQLISFKDGHDTGLAERCGYSLTEKVYQKILEV